MKLINKDGEAAVRSFLVENCKHDLDNDQINEWIDQANAYGHIEIDSLNSVTGLPTPLWLDDCFFDEVKAEE